MWLGGAAERDANRGLEAAARLLIAIAIFVRLFIHGERTVARCIFCGKRPLTKEHIFPKWLAPYIPKTMENYQNVKTIFHKDRADTATKKRAGNPHSWSVKCVCKKCNNERMGTLQERVKPILLPMIKGEKVKIEKADQHVMASWVAMATMCAEFRARTGSNTAPCRYGRMAVDRSFLRNLRLFVSIGEG